MVGLSILGLGIYLVDLIPDGHTEVHSQMSLRLAIVLATVWLAFPQLEQLFQSFSWSVLLIALLGIFVVARNPIILVSIVVLCLVLAAMKFGIRLFTEG